MVRVALFEDHAASRFSPLTLLRPVFELRCGHFSVRERVLTALAPSNWGGCIRSWLQETCTEEFPAARFNDEAWLRAGPTLFINGRWLGDPRELAQTDRLSVGLIDSEVAWLWVEADEAPLIDPNQCDDGIAAIASTRRPVSAGGTLLRYPWDLIHHNAEQIGRDHWLRPCSYPQRTFDSQVALQGPAADICIAPDAVLDPFVVIDARRGPVWIDSGARVLPFTRIEGPCYIGRETQLFRAHVREGASIGPVCRVGGEIEESIFHSYSNKYHDGFLGHSYVCPWVNLGALSTNSDLKNDYSAVKVPLGGRSIDTGSTKVGCFIGDHTKTALGCLFNTGSSIGVMTMILPDGELLPKHLPSFTRLWHGRIEEPPQGIELFLQVARSAMARRQCNLTPAMERLLREVHRQTAGERQGAMQRSQQEPTREALQPLSH